MIASRLTGTINSLVATRRTVGEIRRCARLVARVELRRGWGRFEYFCLRQASGDGWRYLIGTCGLAEKSTRRMMPLHECSGIITA